MTNTPDQNPDDPQAQADLAHQQMLKYGRDLALIYKAEKAKRHKLKLAYQRL
jgi:hypothetical protein